MNTEQGPYMVEEVALAVVCGALFAVALACAIALVAHWVLS